MSDHAYRYLSSLPLHGVAVVVFRNVAIIAQMPEDSRSSCTSGARTTNRDCFDSIHNLQPMQLTASVASDEATLR
jgi:hypothetical protein